MSSKTEIIALTFNHLVLPPKLPGKQDPVLARVEDDIISRLADAAGFLQNNLQDDMTRLWGSIRRSLVKARTINRERLVNKYALLDSLKQIDDHATILHITCQNAGLLIQHSRDRNSVIFEAFEASPSASAVLAAKGSLKCDFPGTSISLPLDDFSDPNFQQSLSAFLEEASDETLGEFSAKSRKAGVTISEHRDTVSPTLVTEFLMTLLETNGSRVSPNTLTKRIKDDVIWNDAYIPWRRSPFWLVLRVSIHRLLSSALGAERGRIQYKFLMCSVFAQLLDDIRNILSPELCDFLSKKLCRRLAKLELEKTRSSTPLRPSYMRLFDIIGPQCQRSIDACACAIKAKWVSFKNTYQRKIPELPMRAREDDLSLTLRNSSLYIHEILNTQIETTNLPSVSPEILRQHSSSGFGDLISDHFDISQLELSSNTETIPAQKNKLEVLCNKLADKIDAYIRAVGDTYNGNPEQYSVFVLSIFEMWANMDRCATLLHPLLNEYHPCFNPELLDVLLLERLGDMERLQAVQSYLHERRMKSGLNAMNIYADPVVGCFSDRYFNTKSAAPLLNKIKEAIEAESRASRDLKKKELKKVNAEYSDLTNKLKQAQCDRLLYPNKKRDPERCAHCKYINRRRRLKIQIHEDFLPTDVPIESFVQKRTIVFELGVERSFIAYRRATWNVINTICFMPTQPTDPPYTVLYNCPNLLRHSRNERPGFSLASKVKPYGKTHYKNQSLPATESNVLLPFGPRFSYYDEARKVWAKDLPTQLSIAHHFQIQIPSENPFAPLFSSPAFAADGIGPSSYEIVASTSHTPFGLNVHEFTANQSMHSGRNRRWLSILTELGASNLDYSLEDTKALFHHLALQVGPVLGNDNLRAVHTVFRDQHFCRRLIGQIDHHVEIIASNWREHYYLETLLTLTLRVYYLGCRETHSLASGLLMKIRRVTLAWIKLLREEMRSACENDASDKIANYTLVSALLCRRTFSPLSYGEFEMDAKSFKTFTETTLVLQENMVISIDSLSDSVKNMLVRDIKMAFRLRHELGRLAAAYPGSMESAINSFWPTVDSASRSYTKWHSIERPQWWVMSNIRNSDHAISQTVHYHLLQGHLLVDGKILGRLPASIRDSEVLKELFGNQRLLAYPSSLPGMRYAIESDMNGHHVHLGHRNGQLVVRAVAKGEILELVPRRVFGYDSDSDLPRSLIDGCTHWMNLRTGHLVARRHPSIWKSRSGDWKLDCYNRRAYRRAASLVDPHSNTAKLIQQIFCHFELPEMLTIHQPVKHGLSVEIKQMDLSFHVNKLGRLQCKELFSEVDANQDAGALYGLQSMLVFRDLPNRSRRSVVVPLGKLRYHLKGPHVLVQIMSSERYAKYTINDVLGRLECAPEPELQYNKAQLHAFTSFVIPDPLTGRTGTEEALCCLRSGYCLPWSPLETTLLTYLKSLLDLAPYREYYPRHLERQQAVKWDPKLTTTIQSDEYYSVVNHILTKSNQLSKFQADAHEYHMETQPIRHLTKRARWRRSIYQRFDAQAAGFLPPADIEYISRDRWMGSTGSANVCEIVSLLLNRSSVPTPRNLGLLLEQWSVIGGYGRALTLSSLARFHSADIGQEWGALVTLCRNCKQEKPYELMFLIGLLAFHNRVDMRILRLLPAFFLLRDLKALTYPSNPFFLQFRMKERPNMQWLVQKILPCCKSFESDSQNSADLKELALLEAAKQNHHGACTKECTEFAKSVMASWPCPPHSFKNFKAEYLSINNALEAVAPEWQRLYDNFQFSNHIIEIQRILDRYRCSGDMIVSYSTSAKHKVFRPQAVPLSVYPKFERDLLAKPVLGPARDLKNDITRQPNPRGRNTLTISEHSLSSIANSQSQLEIEELESIIRSLAESKCAVKAVYGRDLVESVDALKRKSEIGAKKVDKKSMDIQREISKAQRLVQYQFNHINACLYRGESRWLQKGNLLPCVTPTTILEKLRSTSQCVFGSGMKQAFISYALAIVHLQRLLRMKDAHLKKDHGKLIQEYENHGHVNWNPESYPDWLLLEIDADMQIREDQVIVAFEMIAPKSDSNSVFQMNMGQGKTSVIMPMVACALADGKMLARLLVPKALLSQAAQVLQSRLGGLLGRNLAHIPFSRQTHTTLELLNTYFQIHENMRESSGIILGVPEHVLSFKLSGLQKLADSDLDNSRRMITAQQWMDQKCRDVLDECDFTLAVKTQLIYPSGSLLTLDGHPYRWETIQTILDLVAHHLVDIPGNLPESIDVVSRTSEGFPVAHFLRKDAEQALTQKLKIDICSGRLFSLPVLASSDETQQAIEHFMSDETVEDSVVDRLREIFPDSYKGTKILHLLRGLLVHGILILCLKKRWNVQYGFDPKRPPIAVPFRAKGVPSELAEWGHPDVAIILTCLAFYYEGLTKIQFKQSLRTLLRSENPATEYDRWTQFSSTLPPALHHWNVINIDDDRQMGELWSHIRFTPTVINHFLNNFVFPVHCKQFSVKMQTSGWDIPLFCHSNDPSIPKNGRRPGLTTGFSGTNDNRRLLPLTISQRDIPGLSHTNAEVLTYLLQPRNREYIYAVDQNRRRISEVGLLQTLTRRKIRILIDAGAFILEMDNLSVVRAWLQEDWEIPAAVYFGPDNKARVQYRTGRNLPLLATPFADHLDKCLVYLDEAHTRGTDLKLPPNARGALTLGLNQTKDHTVQGLAVALWTFMAKPYFVEPLQMLMVFLAAMRLRQLGTTQSVSFIAPPEVHQSILDVCIKSPNDTIDSSDVVAWLLDRTCASNRDLRSLYFAQGHDFLKRMLAAARFKDNVNDQDSRQKYLGLLLQPEQQTLEQLYRPINYTVGQSEQAAEVPPVGNIGMISRKLIQCQQEYDFAANSISTSALEEVEQEREIMHEIEEEREVQRPPKMSPLHFVRLHASIVHLINVGTLPTNHGMWRASTILEDTELGMKHKVELSSILPNLLLSREFVRTVKLSRGAKNDSFMRPVNWILWSRKCEIALVIVPEEAEEVISRLRIASNPDVHLIIYSAPISKTMMHFNDLTYYTIPKLPSGWCPPSWLPFELGIVGGRLYFTYPDYLWILKTLCPDSRHIEAGDNCKNQQMLQAQNQVLTFLQEWMVLRREGQDISHTPMGYVCQGRALRGNHPFFTAERKDQASLIGDRALSRSTFLTSSEDEEALDSSDDEDLDEDLMMFDDIEDEDLEEIADGETDALDIEPST